MIYQVLLKNKQNHPLNCINIIPIIKDGNCFCRCLSYFFLSDQDYYKEFKYIIIEWIENNYNNFVNFFLDDDINQISKETLEKQELEYIKNKDS